MERVLVVPSGVINFLGFLEGAVDDDIYISMLMKTIQMCGEFMNKDEAEKDFGYRQVIPYVVIGDGDETFVYRRSTEGDEGRLWGLYSLGVGGHINDEDFNGDEGFLDVPGTIKKAALREIKEEVYLDREIEPCDLEFCGVINDTSNDVGKVHIGLIVKLRARVKVALDPALGTFDMFRKGEIVSDFDKFEGWSKLVISCMYKEKG